MKYEEPDRYVWLNTDDRHLFPIKIDLIDLIRRTYEDFGYVAPTSFPKLKYIDGYGKKPEDQVFTRVVYPQRLKDLEKGIRNKYRNDKTGMDRREQNITNDFWDELNDREDDFTEEIEWIKLAWYYRLFGYWFFCNGKPTYMTGVTWVYNNFWYLDDILPEYRDSDRRWFIGQKFLQLDTTTFKDIDPKTHLPLQNVKGEYDMIDIGRKVFIGSNDPKARRWGHTSKAQCDNTEYATRTEESHIGIQGKDEDNAQNVFKNHFLRPFKKLPLIFKPLASALNPSELMSFESDSFEDGLNTRYDFATSQHRSAYDGYKLKRLHIDEPGKLRVENVNKRHEVVKNCLSLGGGYDIIGFMQYTTTVDEMDRSAGENYLALSKGSHYERRNDNGQTETGMANIFIRSTDGRGKFIGKYGESIEEDPTPEQAKFIGETIGAKRYEENIRKQLLQNKQIEKLIERKRQFPMFWAEVFTPPAKNTFFRMDILENRINILQHEIDPPRRGNFYRKSVDRDSDVLWQDDEEHGKFYMSRHFKGEETNKRTRDRGSYRPLGESRFVACGDTFRVEKTQGSRMSNGGGVVRLKHDVLVDPPNKDINDWETSRAVITYNHRPDSLEEYCEDMLMMCVYSGAMMYPEANIDAIEKHFIRRGYSGYLLYDTDWKTGRAKAYAGFYSTIDVKKKIFTLTANDIAVHGHRMRHKDILEECMAIKGIDEMTSFDLFTANGGTLLAEANSYQQQADEEVDSTNFLSTKEY